VKWHHKLFQLFIFLLPTQFGLHFWPDWSLIFGIRVDYLSPTVYLVDLVFGLLFLLWVWEIKFRFVVSKKLLVLLLIFVFLNIYVSVNKGAAVWGWLVIFKLALVGVYVVSNKEKLEERIKTPLAWSLVYSLIIAIFQFINKGSLGGIFYFLGERSFTISTPGIALVNIIGGWQLRPYASFPHPNAMAGYALVGGLLLGPYKNKLHSTGLIAATILVIITFSKTAMIIGFAVVILHRQRIVNITKLVSICLPFTLFVSFLTTYFGSMLLASGIYLPKSIYERLGLLAIAGHLWTNSLIVGVGSRNFIGHLPQESSTLISIVGVGFYRWLQPVHNIYFLILSEMGIIGLIIFIWILQNSIKNVFSQRSLLLSLLAIMLIGLFDHYFITLPQTSSLMAIVIGLSLPNKFVKIDR